MSNHQFALLFDAADQDTATEASLSTFVAQLENDGVTVVLATLDGESIIPTAAERFSAALDRLHAIARQSPRASAEDVREVTDEVERAANALTVASAVGAPAASPTSPAADGVVLAVNADTVAATVSAPTGEEPATDPTA